LVKKETAMKSLILAVALALGTSLAYADEPKKETKKVCVDVKDKEGKPVKDAKGNVKQNCKEVKQHKKLENATVVPDGNKK
jgi:hypothetical protein